MEHCSLSQDVWENGDFTPCFRAIVIDGLIPTILLAWTVGAIVRSVIKYRRSSSPAYSPLKDALPVSYGATHDEQDENVEETASSSSSLAASTITPAFEPKSARWTVFNCTRLMGALLQFALVCVMLHRLNDEKYDVDERVEGSWNNVVISVETSVLFWGAISVLSFVNMLFAGSTKKTICPEITKRLNYLFVCDFLISCLTLRSFYIVHYTSVTSPGYSCALASACITLTMMMIIIHEGSEPEDPVVITDTGRMLSREHWASIYSQFMFSWAEDMMRKGYRNTLNENDLEELSPENRAKSILGEYRKHKTHSILWGLAKNFKKELTIQFMFSMVWSVGLFGPPVLLNKIIKFIETPDQTEPVSTAYLYVIALFLAASAETLASQQCLYIGRTVCIRIQAVVIGEVFDKALRRRAANVTEDEEEASKAKANVNNLLSVDAQKISDFSSYVFYIYSYPVQLVISIACLYNLLGVPALWGVLFMVLAQPVTVYINQKFEDVQDQVMAATDKRLKVINELLQAIRIVKFFAWEEELRGRTLKARDTELKTLRERLMLFMHSNNSWFFIPILIMVVVFYTYTRTNELTASTAFTALAFFNVLRMSLDELPMMFVWGLQARVSAKRIEAFLDQDGVEIKSTQGSTDGVSIGFVGGASFGWDKDESKAIIKDLNVSFPVNKLSIVCGPTGSGKTTLLASLLGETYCFKGESRLPRTLPNRRSPLGGAVSGIAYVAQTAWLQNCSIKDNILFGLPYDEERYEKVLYATALTKDLEIFEFGDSTEVGEKGVTLSGGQKQRLALARAVYSQAVTVILDDCLSAVDAHTAKHLYENCITGELMHGRTIILVTHHVGLCIKNASYIVAMKDGKVASCGHPQTVLQSGALGEELNRKNGEATDVDEEAVDDNAVSSIPTKIHKKHEDGAGKLVKEEVRAEGSVNFDVYRTYVKASGGYLYWLLILFAFSAAQVAVLGQDYWIKVWAGAYKDYSSDANVSSNAIGSLGVMTLQESTLNDFFQPQNVKQEVDVLYYLGIYIVLGLVALLVTTSKSLIIMHGSLLASYRLHEDLLSKILRAKVRFFDTTPVGRIINRFTSDIETIDQEVAMSLSVFLNEVVSTLCIIILISTVMPLFIFPAVIIAALYWIIGFYYLETSRDMKRLNSVSRSPIYVQFEESVNGGATIRAFGASLRFLGENFKRVDDNNRPFLWMWATNRWLHIRVELLGSFVSFCTAFVIILSRNSVDPGMAGLCLSYSLTFTAHVLWVVRMYAQLEMNMNSIERIHEYLDIEEEAPAHIAATEPPANWPETGSVHVEDLVMRYSAESPAVLHNVSFETRAFEKVGIVGRTGSGKSTLTLSIFRFMEPSAGRILIDGIDIGTLGLADLRSRLTIIPQDPILFSGTLRNNLDPFNQHDEAELWAALKRSHLIDDRNDENSEKKITLDSPVLEGGSNWSQGQRQLIALARALVKRSTLIILDEATSSVDFDTDQKIQQTIRAEMSKSSLLCIAHRIRTVADYDRILVFDQGEVKEFDTPYNLITRQGSIFNEMCERSGEYSELLAIATAKHREKNVLSQ